MEKPKLIPSVLIVDDDSINLLFLEELLLELKDIDIYTAKSGFEALEICNKKEMAIVLLDLMMPEMNGFSVIEHMRKTGFNKETPAIIISGASHENTDLPLASITKGAIDFMSKPVNSGLLLGKVKNFIEIFHQKKTLEQLVVQLEESNEKIRDNQILLDNITDVAKDPIAVVNNNFEITFWNVAAVEVFGYLKNEIINRGFSIILSSGDEKTDVFIKVLRNILLNGGNVSDLQGTKEINCVRKNGREFPVEVSVASFVYSGKINLVMILRDITERIFIQNKLLKAKELKEANKIMREFMDNVSHEIRTPMNAIIGISKMILKYNSQNLTEKQREGIELIAGSGNRLLELVNDILDLSRLESKKVQVVNESFSFSKLISSIKNTVIGLIDSKDIKIIVRKSNSIPEFLITDFKKLIQILLNILGNSVKFTEEGKIEINVHVAQDKLYFEISDTGIGMTKDELNIIFDKFRRIENAATKKYKGTGLGLSITKKLIELLGGEIRVESEPGKGTCTTFHIPYVPDEEKNSTIKEEVYVDLQTEEKFTGNKIILVEDDRDHCYLLENYLKIHGYHVLSFNDGLTGYQAIEEVKPDLIILDLNVPVITGFDIMKKLSKNYPGKYPVLIITGNSYVPNKEKYIYRDILFKPIIESMFIETVKKILNEKPENI